MVWSIGAHSNSVASLQLISNPIALLSASYDHTVRLWGISGTQCGSRLGSLLQEVRGGQRHPQWMFQVDVDGIERQEALMTRKMINSLKKRRAGSVPNIPIGLPEIQQTHEAGAAGGGKVETGEGKMAATPWRRASIAGSSGRADECLQIWRHCGSPLRRSVARRGGAAAFLALLTSRTTLMTTILRRTRSSRKNGLRPGPFETLLVSTVQHRSVYPAHRAPNRFSSPWLVAFTATHTAS